MGLFSWFGDGLGSVTGIFLQEKYCSRRYGVAEALAEMYFEKAFRGEAQSPLSCLRYQYAITDRDLHSRRFLFIYHLCKIGSSIIWLFAIISA